MSRNDLANLMTETKQITKTKTKKAPSYPSFSYLSSSSRSNSVDVTLYLPAYQWTIEEWCRSRTRNFRDFQTSMRNPPFLCPIWNRVMLGNGEMDEDGRGWPGGGGGPHCRWQKRIGIWMIPTSSVFTTATLQLRGLDGVVSTESETSGNLFQTLNFKKCWLEIP